MLSFHTNIRNLDGSAAKQYRDPNSRYWHGKAQEAFAAGNYDGTLDRLALANEDCTWRDIAQELEKIAKEH